ncbi:MAG: HU family DNA-binding protein [Armatimonadetes bacterium]|nr:HU family DNA-binding protein [Armatimonadota bacterium]
MTKPELISAVARTTGLKKTKAGIVVDAVFDTMTEALGRNEPVAITRFGTFEVRTRAARMGRNPRTGERIRIAETRACTYRPGKKVREAIGR